MSSIESQGKIPGHELERMQDEAYLHAKKYNESSEFKKAFDSHYENAKVEWLRANSSQPQLGWVRATEQLPENDENRQILVIIGDKEENMILCKYMNDQFWTRRQSYGGAWANIQNKSLEDIRWRLIDAFPLQPIKEPVVEMEYTVEGLLNIIRRAYPYLKDLDSENIDDRSVGMFKDWDLDNVTRDAKYIAELPTSPPSIQQEKEHVHVQLPSGAVANVSPDASPELLNAPDTMVELAKETVSDQAIQQEAAESVYVTWLREFRKSLKDRSDAAFKESQSGVSFSRNLVGFADGLTWALRQADGLLEKEPQMAQQEAIPEAGPIKYSQANIDISEVLKWVAKVAPPEFREEKPYTLKGWRFDGNLLSTDQVAKLYIKSNRISQSSPSAKTEAITATEKPVHPIYKGWDSYKFIGRVRDRFKELIAKEWDWRSFYSGWLEGRSDMLKTMHDEFEAIPDQPSEPSPSPEQSEGEIPEEIEKWIREWLFNNVVSGPDDLEMHNAKVVWSRAIAVAMYWHLQSVVEKQNISILRHISDKIMWNKVDDGLPDYEVPVLWETEEGNHFVSEIDKDDVDWWNGIYSNDGEICWRPKCTHWKKIVTVSEELNNENQKHF